MIVREFNLLKLIKSGVDKFNMNLLFEKTSKSKTEEKEKTLMTGFIQHHFKSTTYKSILLLCTESLS